MCPDYQPNETRGTEAPRLVFGPGVMETLVQHARNDAPLECCGLLLGTGDRVAEAIPGRNELSSEVRYRLHPRDHLAAIRRGRERDLQVVGVYHSHPRSPARPSETDLAEAWEEYVYVIVSPADADGAAVVTAWQVRGGNFVELPLVTAAEEAAESNARQTRRPRLPGPCPPDREQACPDPNDE